MIGYESYEEVYNNVISNTSGIAKLQECKWVAFKAMCMIALHCLLAYPFQD